MNPCALPVGVSALATAIANQIPNDEELALLAAVFDQLGDTLATILAQRAVCARTQASCRQEGPRPGSEAVTAAEEDPLLIQ